METMTSEMKPLRLQLELDLADGRRDIKARQRNRIQRIKDPLVGLSSVQNQQKEHFDCVVNVYE